MESILDDLRRHRLPCAPHVAARLIRESVADETTVRQLAGTLDELQRRGLSVLPSPLPSVPAIDDAFADLRIGDRDRDLLVAVTLILDDRLEPILDIDGRTPQQLSRGAVSELLTIRAGRVQLRDPRLAIWLRATTSPARAAVVHERLSRAYEARSEHRNAEWHRARAATSSTPRAVAELVRMATEHSQEGADERAVHLANEAAAHARGPGRSEALLVGGRAAVAAGYAADGAALLAEVFRDGPEHDRLQGLGALFVAQAHLRGSVPDIDPESLRPRSADDEDGHAWARACALAAVHCAERRDRPAMRRWLDALRRASERGGGAERLRRPVTALAWVLAGDREPVDVSAGGPLTGALLGALGAALDGEIDAALALLATGDSGIDVEDDPFVAGFERSALVHAYRAVLEVLLLVWRGDIGCARDRLHRAAMHLPVALPFAGLGVILARRLDLAVLGRLGPFSLALTASLPAPLRIDRLTDRAIEAFLAGSPDEAIACMTLWADRGSSRPTLFVPGLDEVVVKGGSSGSLPRQVAPPDAVGAIAVARRITESSEATWRTVGQEVTAEVRSVRSPFARGRVEAMIAARALAQGDVVAAREHLVASRNLLEVSGASAWARAVDDRLLRLADDETASVRDPLATSRRMWEPLLTRRELDVAMMAVAGASNREIGEALSVSVRTVEVHLGRVFSKLEVRSRVELTVAAHRAGQLA